MKKLILLSLIALGMNAAALEVGDQAPCVVVNQIQTNNTESEHCIRDHLDSQKATLMEFFSITCTSCEQNLPNVINLGSALAPQATTRMISIDRSVTDVKNYITKNRQHLPFEIALDSDRDAKAAYGVVATPTLFVLDKNNTVVFKHMGILSAKDISDIETLVQGL